MHAYVQPTGQRRFPHSLLKSAMLVYISALKSISSRSCESLRNHEVSVHQYLHFKICSLYQNFCKYCLNKSKLFMTGIPGVIQRFIFFCFATTPDAFSGSRYPSHGTQRVCCIDAYADMWECGFVVVPPSLNDSVNSQRSGAPSKSWAKSAEL